MPKLLGLIAIAFLLWTLFSAQIQPPSSVDGKEPVPYTPSRLGGWKSKSDGEGLLTISNAAGDTVAQYTLGDDGVLHQDPEQAANGRFKSEFRPDEYIGRWWTDVGTWTAYDTDLRLGVRISPCRLGWGCFAPDIVASESAIGVGLSAYMPKRSVGVWSHVGLGAWLTHDIDTGSNGVSFGVSTSIR